MKSLIVNAIVFAGAALVGAVCEKKYGVCEKITKLGKKAKGEVEEKVEDIHRAK